MRYKYKCVDNKYKEDYLTLGKIYDGYPYTVGSLTYIKILVCDNNEYDLFSDFRFEVVE